jgi:hypothetical protein
MSRRFFLSHSTKDKNLVSGFMELMRSGMDLREQDIFCTSQESIRVSESYIDVIRDNFNKAAVIILLISKNYMESPFCLCEMGAAWASEKAIFPILVDVDYKAIEYPTTPFKTTQVGDLNKMDDLLSIYDDLKANRHISARTSLFHYQLAVFIKKELWAYPVEAPLIASKTTKEKHDFEIENIVFELSRREEALKLLNPLSDFDLSKLEPSSRMLTKIHLDNKS